MWILAVVAGVVAFFLLLLSVPVDLKVILEKDDGVRSRFRLEWMFGLVGKDIHKKRAKPPKKKRKPRRLPKVRPFLAVLRNRGFVRGAARFLKDIIRLIRIRELTVDLHLGLPDPADTGLLFGAVGPPTLLVNHLTPARIRIYPDFERATFRGTLRGHLRVLPIQIVARATVFLFSPETLRAVKTMAVTWRK